MCFVVPEGIPLEEAATFGIGYMTAAQAVVYSQGKALPPGDTKVSGNSWYIVYGASASVGLFATSLAKALGYRVLGICSPHSFSLVKSYGADATIDYHNQSQAISEALDLTDGGVEFALDAISEGDSFRNIVKMMGQRGKQLNVMLPVPDDVRKINPELKIEFTGVRTLWGAEFKFGLRDSEKSTWPADPNGRVFGEELFRKTPELVAKYGIKPNPVKIRGGFEDIGAGLEDLKDGKVSGQKLVLKVA
ncbi:hypothetical protein CNBB5510 [Cryptococcus deneoformans B-3501A]|nr:hypothetical protein CNBB5510 [Cryptococcus neoformans var. neoformans B-3501A]EAL22378.1 hypothetical protein CNBB5510 [Cryptococcus neoformans var. neoformans B-3501A]